MMVHHAARHIRGLAPGVALLATAAGLPALAAAPLDADKVFAQLDANHDGSITTSEWTKAGQKADQFPNVDANHDGMIVRDELRVALDRAAAASAPSDSGATATPPQ